jgi:hypothetical protein
MGTKALSKETITNEIKLTEISLFLLKNNHCMVTIHMPSDYYLKENNFVLVHKNFTYVKIDRILPQPFLPSNK